MSQVELCIHKQPAAFRPLSMALREIVLAQSPLVHEQIKWGLPFFAAHRDLCYLNVPKGKHYVELCFIQGHKLSNAQGALHVAGRRWIHGLRFESLSDLDGDLVREVVQEALMVDEDVHRSGGKTYTK